MKNWKISRKMVVTFGIITVLFCVALAVSIVSLMSNGNRFENFYQTGHQLTVKALEQQKAIQASAKYIGYSMMEADTAKTAQYIESAKNETENMKAGLAFMRQAFQGEEAKLLESFNDAMAGISEARIQVYELAAANKNDEASALYFQSVMPGYLAANDYLTQIYDMVADSAAQNFAAAQRAETTTVILLAVLALVVLGTTLFLSWYLTRSMTGPIAEIESAATEMSHGNLAVEISYESRDELGHLAQATRALAEGFRSIVADVGHVLGDMAQGNFQTTSGARQYYVGDFAPILEAMQDIKTRLNDTLSQINRTADQVAGGSDQVSSGAQALSQGATEQASSVEELAATIGEISSQIKENADNAGNASRIASRVGDEMMESNRQMQEMIQAMSEITTSSQEIGKIIKAIEDIAFQTNILALNAAVEAARAGAAGKGFAVVADEVRALANKSSEASKNTAALIEGSLRAVENGSRIADATARSMVAAVDGAKEVAQTVDRISSASVEQAQSIAQVNQGVEQISSVVQTNSATAEESAAASEELSSQAQVLKNLVGKFRLEQASTGLAGAGEAQARTMTEPVSRALPSGVGISADNY